MRQWRDPLPGAPPASFWGLLDPASRRALGAIGGFARHAAGAPLCHEGQPVERVHLVMSGVVEAFRDDDGHRTVLARRGPGDIVGEFAAVDGHPASATVLAVGPAVTLAIPTARFSAACRERPHVAWEVLRIAVARLRESDGHRTRARSDVPRRVVAQLLELAPRSARGVVTVAVTQRDLADMVSASLVSVTRALDELRRAGVVTTLRGRVEVDVDAARRLLAD